MRAFKPSLDRVSISQDVLIALNFVGSVENLQTNKSKL